MSDEPQPMPAFRYVRPPADRSKSSTWLATTDHVFATVQLVSDGRETNLHAHDHLDGLWFVLSGRARFCSDEQTLVAEVGERDGELIPRGAKYRFESVGPEPLEVLQVE